MQEALRQIPSVEKVLSTPAVQRLLESESRPVVVRAIRERLEALRRDVRAGDPSASDVPGAESIGHEVSERVGRHPHGLRRVLNATGVVLHTNLGRARLAEEAVRALVDSARGACDLELDLESGKRGSRTARVERRLVEITGAESALVVNNNAGALVLAINELARGREAVVSRGELIEIGGSFRLPDVMERAGARLVEVGTTNRTHRADYERAIGPDTAILLKVHRSNFRQDGFVTEPPLAELVDLGRSRGILVLHDLGSGALHRLPVAPDEPRIAESLAAGVDVVTLSGDKLLGGPQAGILLGRRDVLDRLRQSPLARALRVDKFTIAALAATLDLLEDAERARERIPVLRALCETPERLAQRAASLARGLEGLEQLEVLCREGSGEVGGGAVPAVELPTTTVCLRHATLSADELAAELRRLPLPVVGRIEDGWVRLDPRSLDPSEDAECAQALCARFGTGGR